MDSFKMLKRQDRYFTFFVLGSAVLFSFCYLFSQETDVEKLQQRDYSNLKVYLAQVLENPSLFNPILKLLWLCTLGFLGCKSFAVLSRYAWCWYWWPAGKIYYFLINNFCFLFCVWFIIFHTFVSTAEGWLDDYANCWSWDNSSCSYLGCFPSVTSMHLRVFYIFSMTA